MYFLLLTQNRVTKLMIMNTLKKLLSIISLFFISCDSYTEPDPLYPVPIVRVKMGEKSTIDLSNYFYNKLILRTKLYYNFSFFYFDFLEGIQIII